MRLRSGFTLVELMVTVTLIGILVYIGASSMTTSDIEDTRNGAYDVIDVFRRARYVSSRQNAAVVVVVLPFGTAVPGGTTRGLVRAFLTDADTCPGSRPTDLDDIFFEIDFGLTGGDNRGPGIAEISPAAMAIQDFCVLPSGRVINNTTGSPVRATGADPDSLAGTASIVVQHEPLRVIDGVWVPPVVRVEVPFNGLTRIPQ